MAVKESPVNLRTFHRMYKEEQCKLLDADIEEKKKLKEEIEELYNVLFNKINYYKERYNVNLMSYDEFRDNNYINGELFRDARGLYLNRKDDYKIVADLYDLLKYASKHKRLVECNKEIEFYKKTSILNFKQYCEYVRVYYMEVHKKLVLEGKGYVYSNNIGWICFNRYKLSHKNPMLDFAATREREAKLKAEGKRIWNKEEAEWCARNGIEYKAEDKRVFRRDEYSYELCLLDSRLHNGDYLELEATDYRHLSLRGKTYQDYLDMCNNDVNKICELQVDAKMKLVLCNLVDKTLYHKYIRNEYQKSHKDKQANRKNRQRL